MKITETNTTIGALIERLEQTGKSLATKVRAFILIEDDEPDQSMEDARETVVLYLFRQKRISIRKGAELLGISYRAFLTRLARRQIPSNDCEVGEIDGDLEAFGKIKRQVE